MAALHRGYKYHGLSSRSNYNVHLTESGKVAGPIYLDSLKERGQWQEPFEATLAPPTATEVEKFLVLGDPVSVIITPFGVELGLPPHGTGLEKRFRFGSVCTACCY